MTLEEMRAEYDRRYANDAYANDEPTANLFRLLDAARSLSPKAQAEFVTAFDFEFALDGVVYVGTKTRLRVAYPNLAAEAETAGIKLEVR